jgi:hypothetical protein
MTRSDYIPAKDADFDAFFNNLCQYVGDRTGGNVPQWTHIPPEARTNLNDACTVWGEAYDKTKIPHTKAETDAKNAARAAAETLIRPFVNQYLRYPPVTDSDRDAMMIHNKDANPTPAPTRSGAPKSSTPSAPRGSPPPPPTGTLRSPNSPTRPPRTSPSPCPPKAKPSTSAPAGKTPVT